MIDIDLGLLTSTFLCVKTDNIFPQIIFNFEMTDRNNVNG